jgi:hypothetical protein
MIEMSKSVVVQFVELSLARHCEEQRDEATWAGR